MPGIVAVVDHGGRVSPEQFLPRMLAAVRHEPFYATESFTGDGIGLGWVGIPDPVPGGRRTVAQQGETVAVMHGEIFGGLDAEPCPGETRQSPLPVSQVLSCYRRHGPAAFATANGAFNLAVWDGRKRELTVVNDRFGILPLRYWSHNERLLLSPEVGALALDPACRLELDPVALKSFFAFGFVLNQRTFFKGLPLVPPASVLTFGPDGLRVRRYWDCDAAGNAGAMSEDECLEGLLHHLRQAVERRTADGRRIGMGLSGGLDSRTVCALVPRSRYPVHTFSFGTPGCPDREYAGMIADHLGTTHHEVELRAADFAEAFETMARQTGCYPDVAFYHCFASAKAKRHHADIELSATGGDALTGQINKFTGLFPPSGRRYVGERARAALEDELFRRMMRGGIPEDAPLYSPDFRKAASGCLREEFRESFKPIEAECFQDIVVHLKVQQMERRLTLPAIDLYGRQVMVRYPFYDYDLVDFLLSVPPEHRDNQRLYKRCIRTRLPGVAGVPHAVTGRPVREGDRRGVIAALVKSQLSAVARRAAGLKLGKPGTFDFYAQWFAGPLHDLVEHVLLRDGARERGYFEESAVRSLVRRHVARKASSPWPLFRLLTVEMLHRVFLEGTQQDCG